MEPVTTWAAPQNVSFILSRIPEDPGSGVVSKVKPRLVPRASTDRFGMDADAAEADGYRCVSGRFGPVRLSGLDAAQHAAPGLLSRRQHLLGLRAKPGDGGRISHPEPAGRAISN